MTAELHLAKNALPLHLLFQRSEGLLYIVVTNENLHLALLLGRVIDGFIACHYRSCAWPPKISRPRKRLARRRDHDV